MRPAVVGAPSPWEEEVCRPQERARCQTEHINQCLGLEKAKIDLWLHFKPERQGAGLWSEIFRSCCVGNRDEALKEVT